MTKYILSLLIYYSEFFDKLTFINTIKLFYQSMKEQSWNTSFTCENSIRRRILINNYTTNDDNCRSENAQKAGPLQGPVASDISQFWKKKCLTLLLRTKFAAKISLC